MADLDREEIILEMARMMWRKGMSIADFYEAMGINLENLDESDPTDVVSLIAGVFTGWKNPPNPSKAQSFSVPADAA